MNTLLAAALEQDPSLAAAAARADATAARVGQARAGLLPRLSATAGYTRNQYATEVDLPGGDPVVITPEDQLDATVRVDVPVVDVSAWSTLAAARECREAGDADADATTQDALLAVIRAAWDLRTAERARAAAAAAVEANERVVARATARREAGTGANLDLLRATADLARTRGDLADADATLSAARRALAARTGLDALPGDLSPRAAPAGEPLSTGASDPAGAPVTPAVAAARATLDCRSRTEAATTLGALPTVAAFAQERFSNATGFTGEAASWALGATVSWVPVEGGRRAAQVAEAAANRRAAEADLAQVERAAADALADARARLTAATLSLDAARTRATAAEAASADARARFEAGTGLAVEVSLSVDEALDAAVALARAEATHALAVESLRVAAGQPLVEAR